jgi:hypothetical protein
MEKGRAVADAALFIGLAYFSHGLQSLLFLLCTACRCLLLRVMSALQQQRKGIARIG